MKNNQFTELLNQRVVIGDGAMGTLIYQKGIFVNTCFDELNLTRPDLIKQIHCEYIQAGCDFIETNTFGANEIKLGKYGLADKVEVINETAAQLAKNASETNPIVAGSMGPIGTEITAYGSLTREKAKAVFKRQADALIKAGVDLLILETFSNPDELKIALSSLENLPELPIIAQLVTSGDSNSIFGQPIEQIISEVASLEKVTAIGLNCSEGPSGMLESLQKIRNATDKPISIQPNAGMPQDIDGRTMYMCTPEYMAEYAKRFFENGARIIGGCCGTTPAHMREITKAVLSLDKAAVIKPKSPVTSTIQVKDKTGLEPIALSSRSKIGAKLANEELIYSVELTPPRGVDLTKTLEKAKLCADHGIDAINIPDGPRASSRMSPLVTAVKIQEAAEIETILHICCRDRNIIAMQSDLLGAQAIGLRNVLLVTGDPPKLGEYPDATAVFDLDSINLTHIVQQLNRGLDVAGNEFNPPLSMTVGVGANPVASDIHREIERFKQKVEAGAEYAITQPVFDTEMFYTFQAAITDFEIPLIAGIWPFTSYKNAEFMANEVPGVVVPEKLLNRMSKATTREDGRKIGIEIAREMIDEIKAHVAGFAVSAPFGNVRIALAVLDKIKIEDI